jgi:hypothetical protein
MSGLAHIPAPSEATSVDEWDFFERDCGHQYWIRKFVVRTWTVEAGFTARIEVELGGFQLSDGSIELGIWIDGDTYHLSTDEALMLASTLSRAAEEQERVRGGVK